MTDVLLTPLELVLGRPLGDDPDAPELPAEAPSRAPREILAEVVRGALERPPCLVLFSGGRDSSGMLALAVRTAREHGLPPPVPFTLRFPDVAESHEGEWQERVVRHLGLVEWTRCDVDDELDLLGPYAQRAMRRYGCVWPPNAYVLMTAAEAAGRGTVLTGSFGDEMFTADARMLATRAALGGAGRLTGRDLLRVALARSPRAVRRMVAGRRYVKGRDLPPWVGGSIRGRAIAALADDLASMELRWDRDVRSAWRRRYTQIVRRVLERVATDEGSRLVSPFGDPRFRVAFARLGGAYGFGSRTEAMQALFSDLLPEDVLQRSTKASFQGAFWNRASLAFVRSWSKQGLDPRWVDLDALDRAWRWDPERPGRPDFRSAGLLQAAWLATTGEVTPISPGPRASHAPS